MMDTLLLILAEVENNWDTLVTIGKWTHHYRETLVPIVGWTGALLVAIAAIYAWILTRNAALYATFDALYQDMLQRAMDKPWLRDPDTTQKYKAKLTGSSLVLYDTYAYMVFNVCETIADSLDIYGKRFRGLVWVEGLIRWAFPSIGDRDWLRETWWPVLVGEKELHSKWLEEQQKRPGIRFKPQFLDLMKKAGTPGPYPWEVGSNSIRTKTVAWVKRFIGKSTPG